MEYAGKTDDGAILAQSPSEAAQLWPHAEQSRRKSPVFRRQPRDTGVAPSRQTVPEKVRLVYIDPPFSTQTMFHSRSWNTPTRTSSPGPSSSNRFVNDWSSCTSYSPGMAQFTFILMKRWFSTPRLSWTRSSNRRTTPTVSPGKSAIRRTIRGRHTGTSRTHPLLHEIRKIRVEPSPGSVDRKRAKEYQYVEPENGRRSMKVPVHRPAFETAQQGPRGEELSPSRKTLAISPENARPNGCPRRNLLVGKRQS